MFCEDYSALVGKLEGRGFIVHSAADATEAKKAALELIGTSSVGMGGSMTVKELGLYDALQQQGNTVYWHWRAEPSERESVCECAANADFYLCSVNALTSDGVLVNIDGTGNRVAGMFAGPKRTVLIIGKNKLTADVDSAIKRIKAEACPPNAKRLGLELPCAITGKCTDCHSPKRMCRVTSIMEYPPRLLKELHVILVDEVLGY